MSQTALDTLVEDVLDLDACYRAWHGSHPGRHLQPAAVRDAQLTVTRNQSNDLQDRQVYLFVDDEPWGKVKYGQAVSREIAPGHHRVRVFNTMFSHTLEFDATPGEHVRLRCRNGIPKAGWLMMIVLQVTYLRVSLERE